MTLSAVLILFCSSFVPCQISSIAHQSTTNLYGSKLFIRFCDASKDIYYEYCLCFSYCYNYSFCALSAQVLSRLVCGLCSYGLYWLFEEDCQVSSYLPLCYPIWYNMYSIGVLLFVNNIEWNRSGEWGDHVTLQAAADWVLLLTFILVFHSLTYHFGWFLIYKYFNFVNPLGSNVSVFKLGIIQDPTLRVWVNQFNQSMM